MHFARHFGNFGLGLARHFGLGFGSEPKTKPKPPKKINLGLDSELNSIHFGIEINIL